jgi:hypothetical protein
VKFEATPEIAIQFTSCVIASIMVTIFMRVVGGMPFGLAGMALLTIVNIIPFWIYSIGMIRVLSRLENALPLSEKPQLPIPPWPDTIKWSSPRVIYRTDDGEEVVIQ